MAAQYGFSVNISGDAVTVMRGIEHELAKLGIKAKLETEKVHHSFHKMGEQLKETLGGIKNLILGGMGLSVGTQLITGFEEFLRSSLEGYDKLEAAEADLTQTMKTMHYASGVSEEDMLKQAKAISSVSVFSRTAIISAEAMMATFREVKGTQFAESIQAAADSAKKFYGGDMVQAAKSLGIALTDPEKSVGRLKRQGIEFSAEQKKQIKHYQDIGQLAKAQEIILKEINTEVGGQAVAFAGTDEGKVEMAKKKWNDIKLMFGEFISKLKVAVIPFMLALINGLTAVGHWLAGTSKSAEIFKDVLLATAIVLGVYYGWMMLVAGVTKLVTAGQWLLNVALTANPIGIVLGLVIALAAGFMYLWDNCRTFREGMGATWAVVKKIIGGMVDAFQDLGQIIHDVFTGNWGNLKADWKKYTDDMKEDFGSGWGEAVQKGMDDAGKSKFKFGDVLNKLTGGGQHGPEGEGHGGRAAKQSAINTSELGGAKGGLGEAKVINIKIDTMQKVSLGTSRELKAAGQDAVEVMLKTLNNIAYSQSSSQ